MKLYLNFALMIALLLGFSVCWFRIGKASGKISDCSTKQGYDSRPNFLFHIVTVDETNNRKDYPHNNTKSDSIIYRNVFLTNNNGNYYGERNETYNWNSNIVYVHFSFSQHDCRTAW